LKILPYFRGCWLLYCRFFSLWRKNWRQIKIEVILDDKLIFSVIFDLSNPTEFNMVRQERFDLGSALTIWSLLERDDLFIDVGANFGYFSRIAKDKISPDGKVVAIEPNKAAFNLLMRGNTANMEVINKVVGQKSGEKFHIHKPFYRQTTGSRFLLDPNGEIESISLSDVYLNLNRPKVKLIKIDTEGAELPVLEGAQEIFKSEKPFVIAEVSDYSKHFHYRSNDVYEFMKRLGYIYFYSISDKDVSMTAITEPIEGQILFSPIKL